MTRLSACSAFLERQKQVLELYCARQGWTFEVIADLGSGINNTALPAVPNWGKNRA